jgi:hypothetical protein
MLCMYNTVQIFLCTEIYVYLILTLINGQIPCNFAVILDNRSIGPEILKFSATINVPVIIFDWMAQTSSVFDCTFVIYVI